MCNNYNKSRWRNQFKSKQVAYPAFFNDIFKTDKKFKIKNIPTNLMVLDNEQMLHDFRAIVQCDKPNANLHNFKGKLIARNIEMY